MGGTLILATHGIEGGPGVAIRHARAIRARGGWSEVRVGCLKAEPSLASALRHATGPIIVVPLLMAEGYIHGTLRRRVGELAPQGSWRMAAPVGLSPGLPELIHMRAEALRLAQGWPVAGTSLLLIGHGTPRHPASAAHVRAMAEALAGRGYAAVAAATLEERPLPRAAMASLAGERVIAVGLFLDDGPHGDADVRAALKGVDRPLAYAGAVGADEALVPLILAEAAAVQ